MSSSSSMSTATTTTRKSSRMCGRSSTRSIIQLVLILLIANCSANSVLDTIFIENEKESRQSGDSTLFSCGPNLLIQADVDGSGWLDQLEYQFVLTKLAQPYNENIDMNDNNDMNLNQPTNTDTDDSNNVTFPQDYCDIISAYYYSDLLQSVWEVLSCLCDQFDNTDNTDSAHDSLCCNSTYPQVAVPGRNVLYPEPLYSTKVCQVLDRAVLSECSRLQTSHDQDDHSTTTLTTNTPTLPPTNSQTGTMTSGDAHQLDDTALTNTFPTNNITNITQTNNTNAVDSVVDHQQQQQQQQEEQIQQMTTAQLFRQPETLASIGAMILFILFWCFCCFYDNRKKKQDQTIQGDLAYIETPQNQNRHIQEPEEKNELAIPRDISIETPQDPFNNNNNNMMPPNNTNRNDTNNHNGNNNYNNTNQNNNNNYNRFRISNILSGMDLQIHTTINSTTTTQKDQGREEAQEGYSPVQHQQLQHHQQQVGGGLDLESAANASLNTTIASCLSDNSNSCGIANSTMDTTLQIFINDDENSSVEDILHRRQLLNSRRRRRRRLQRQNSCYHSLGDNNNSNNSANNQYHLSDDEESVWDMLRRSSSHGKNQQLEEVSNESEAESFDCEEYHQTQEEKENEASIFADANISADSNQDTSVNHAVPVTSTVAIPDDIVCHGTRREDQTEKQLKGRLHQDKSTPTNSTDGKHKNERSNFSVVETTNIRQQQEGRKEYQHCSSSNTEDIGQQHNANVLLDLTNVVSATYDSVRQGGSSDIHEESTTHEPSDRPAIEQPTLSIKQDIVYASNDQENNSCMYQPEQRRQQTRQGTDTTSIFANTNKDYENENKLTSVSVQMKSLAKLQQHIKQGDQTIQLEQHESNDTRTADATCQRQMEEHSAVISQYQVVSVLQQKNNKVEQGQKLLPEQSSSETIVIGPQKQDQLKKKFPDLDLTKLIVVTNTSQPTTNGVFDNDELTTPTNENAQQRRHHHQQQHREDKVSTTPSTSPESSSSSLSSEKSQLSSFSSDDDISSNTNLLIKSTVSPCGQQEQEEHNSMPSIIQIAPTMVQAADSSPNTF